MKWFILVVGSRDYYLVFDRIEIVGAENAAFAISKVILQNAEEIVEVIYCGNHKPKIV